MNALEFGIALHKGMAQLVSGNEAKADAGAKKQAPKAKRHPWVCYAKTKKLESGRLVECRTHNLARYEACHACGAPYAQGEPYTLPDPGTEIATRATMREALTEYGELISRARVHFEALYQIENRIGELFDSKRERIKICETTHEGRVSFKNPEKSIERVNREVWGRIVGLLEVDRFISDKRGQEIGEMLTKGKLPPLTPESVEAWALNIIGNAEELLREKIEEVFNYLRPHNDRFKTNSQFEIGKRVVLTYCVEKADPRFTWRPSLNYHMHQMFNSIESLFRTLEGKGTATTASRSDIQQAIAKADSENPTGETDYFKFRACRNGNLHLEFKRLDLLAVLNREGGGKNLKGERPVARGRKRR